MGDSLLERLYRERHDGSGSKPAPAPRPAPNRGAGHRYGERHPRALLDRAKVVQARDRYRAGESVPEIASDLGVSRACLYKMLQNRSWRHVLDPLGSVTMRRGGMIGNRRRSALDRGRVMAIRAEAGPAPRPRGTVKRLASKYDVSPATMSELLSGATWRDEDT